MTIDEFCKEHPHLFHMATADSLSQIMRYGLLSCAAILELTETAAVDRDLLSSTRRPAMVAIDHPTRGRFTLRDQKPLRDAALAECLDGMTIPEWYRCLNSRVFMWAQRDRVEKLLAARAYRGTDQLVLTIDSKLLLVEHYLETQVSTINSGATLYVPVRRGLDTFIPLRDYPVSRKARPIVEVTVPHAIPKMSSFIVHSEIRKGTAR